MTTERSIERAATERGKAVEAAILAIEKQFGTGSIMKLGSAARQQVDFIPTGSIALDLALGVGGIPRGRVTEIFGPESSGKTTVCQHVIAEAQRRGGVAAFIDVEHALDPGYARACGVNVDELLVSQPDTGEQALEITETLIRSGGIDVVVVDSVAALVPRAEIEGEMGDSFVGIQARLMSQALRKLTGAVSRSNTSLVFTNQLREKIGVMFGNPETTPGRPGPEVLRQRPAGHPPDRDDQVRHRVDRQPRPRQGREEQGRAAVPRRRVRRHVRRGHLEGGRPARRRRRHGRRRQDRLVVHVRGEPPRPGPRGVQGVPQGQRCDRSDDRGQDPQQGQRGRRSRSRASRRPSNPRADGVAELRLRPRSGCRRSVGANRRCRLRSSLTHVGVRSLRCSAPP